MNHNVWALGVLLRYRPRVNIAMCRRVGVLVASGALFTGPGWAETDAQRRQRARDNYARGAEAYEAGRHADAAVAFAAADDLIPNDVTLRMALESAINGDQAVLALRLSRRVRQRALGDKVAQLATRAEAEFTGRVGRVRLDCPAPRKCLLQGGDAQVEGDAVFYLEPGPHSLNVTVDGSRRVEEVDARPGEVVVIASAPESDPVVRDFPEPAPPAVVSVSTPGEPDSSASSSSKGWTPGVFWVGVGVTVVVGGVTTWSALDTKSKHDAFLAGEDTRASGQSATRRTNGLLAGTAVALAATGIIGIAFTDWSGKKGSKASVGVAPGGAMLWLRTDL